MSFILFFIGLAVLGYGKVSFANVDAEGPKVRAAGFILMMPFIAQLFIGFMVGVLFISDESESLGAAGTFLTLLEIAAMIICVGVAYTLVTDESPANIIRMPGMDTKTTDKDDKSTNNTTQQKNAQPKPRPQQTRQSRPAPPKPARSQPAARKGNFPTIMSTAEAARYLNVSESDVMALINDGKISAARINYRYRISKDVLDDYLSEQQG